MDELGSRPGETLVAVADSVATTLEQVGQYDDSSIGVVWVLEFA